MTMRLLKASLLPLKKRVTQRKICSNRDYARTEIFNLTRCSTIRQSNIVILEVFLQPSAKKTIIQARKSLAKAGESSIKVLLTVKTASLINHHVLV